MYTQNIDSLERLAGIPGERLVEAHGTFTAAHCTSKLCSNREHSAEWVKAKIVAGETPCCSKCGSLVKPDIVFFGEELPQRYQRCVDADFNSCDLLLVLGTSLQIPPVCMLIGAVSTSTPRVLINRDAVGLATVSSGCEQHDWTNSVGNYDQYGGHGFLFHDPERNLRDVGLVGGDCDVTLHRLAASLGWLPEMNALILKDEARPLRELCDERLQPVSRPSGKHRTVQEQKQLLRQQAQKLRCYIGTQVRKDFPGHGWFSGRVRHVKLVEPLGKHKETALYLNIKYDDGDDEDVTEENLEVLVGNYVAEEVRRQAAHKPT
jgi:hypothetical protein